MSILKNFEIFISTVSSKAFTVIESFNKYNLADGKINIIIQYSDDKFVDYCHQFMNDNYFENVKVYYQKGSGLSKSRNLALQKSTKRFLYLTDDDIQLNLENIEVAVSKLNDFDLDFIVGTVETTEGVPFKNYEKRTKKLIGVFNSAQVSSVELILSRDFIKQHELTFDERFGLGAEYTNSEEYIFVTDMLKNEGKGQFLNINICQHPYESSGKKVGDNQFWYTRGAVFKRIFGMKGCFIATAFYLKKFLLRNDVTAMHLIQLIKGFKNFKQ